MKRQATQNREIERESWFPAPSANDVGIGGQDCAGGSHTLVARLRTKHAPFLRSECRLPAAEPARRRRGPRLHRQLWSRRQVLDSLRPVFSGALVLVSRAQPPLGPHVISEGD